MDTTPILSLGLTENTSKIQAKNGTRSFFDPQTNSSYQIHTNGYIRRTVFYSYTQYSKITGLTQVNKWARNYQINPKKIRTRIWVHKINGKRHEITRTHHCRVRIKNIDEQIKIVVQRILSYRQYQNSPRFKPTHVYAITR